TSEVNLNLGSGASTVNVLGTGVSTNIFNRAFATINVGNAGSLADIQGALNLENDPSYDTIYIDDQNDTVRQTATLETFTGSLMPQCGRLTGLTPATITWDYIDTAGVTIFGGSGGNVFNIESTRRPTTIFGGTGVNCFHVSPTALSLADIWGPLMLNGSGADRL